jgi:photosystem II stability/assembly factor-like uncharacterized protein
MYAGTQDTGTIRFGGTVQWERVLRGDGGSSAVSTADPNRIYQITRISSSSPNVFRRSANGGDTWLIRVNGIDPADPRNFYLPFVMDPADSNRLLLGTNRVYEATNGGDAWMAISTPNAGGWTSADNIDSLAASASDVNTIYASAGGRIFITLDRGTTWLERSVTGLANPHFRALAVDPAANQIAYAARVPFDGGHVFPTTNGGQGWIDISGNLANLPTNTIALDTRTTPATLYVGTDDGVYASTDVGATWSRFRAGFPNAQVIELKLNTTLNILAAATHGRGVWEILVSGP